jgi:hypothetical protein
MHSCAICQMGVSPGEERSIEHTLPKDMQIRTTQHHLTNESVM